jgi:hypothetical protein
MILKAIQFKHLKNPNVNLIWINSVKLKVDQMLKKTILDQIKVSKSISLIKTFRLSLDIKSNH